MVDGATALGFAFFSLQGEAMAVRSMGHLLQSNNVTSATIEGDNKSVIHLCSTKNVPP